MTRTRGEQRFASVTYSQLAEWTGLSLNTIRNYATQGAFDRHSIESVLAWVNGRRAARGLPMIGLPAEVLPPITGTKDSTRPADFAIDWIGNGSPLPRPASGGYNAQTGGYDQ